MLHVTKAGYIGDYRIHLVFNDGQSGDVDLSTSLDGPIFVALKDLDTFRAFCVEGHTLSWPNGADFAPEYLQSLINCEIIAEQI